MDADPVVSSSACSDCNLTLEGTNEDVKPSDELTFNYPSCSEYDDDEYVTLFKKIDFTISKRPRISSVCWYGPQKHTTDC